MGHRHTKEGPKPPKCSKREDSALLCRANSATFTCPHMFTEAIVGQFGLGSLQLVPNEVVVSIATFLPLPSVVHGLSSASRGLRAHLHTCGAIDYWTLALQEPLQVVFFSEHTIRHADALLRTLSEAAADSRPSVPSRQQRLCCCAFVAVVRCYLSSQEMEARKQMHLASVQSEETRITKRMRQQVQRQNAKLAAIFAIEVVVVLGLTCLSVYFCFSSINHVASLLVPQCGPRSKSRLGLSVAPKTIERD